MEPSKPPQIPDALKRVFIGTFTARDLAEPLASFDCTARALEVRASMDRKDLDVVGVRRDGRIVGFVRREQLDGGDLGEHCLPFEGVPVRDDATPLIDVLLELNRAPVVFISLLGSVGAIVTMSDLQKPAVRMWLFGLLTLIEMRFTELIERHCPGDAWRQFVSEGRLQRAQALLNERRRLNRLVRTLDCLQLADKGQIVARNADIRQHTIFPSRRQAETALSKLERLRNNLAHAQDIVTEDWETIVRLSEFAAHQFTSSPQGLSSEDR